ncbi:MAG TPA: hypothetical protein VH500_01010 [Nitrososphaeraceae archaeon]
MTCAHPYQGGIVSVAYDISPEGISLVYHYADHTSVNHGIDHFDS